MLFYVRDIIRRHAESNPKLAGRYIAMDGPSGWPHVRVSGPFMVGLLLMSFPGNLRDLENVVVQAMIRMGETSGLLQLPPDLSPVRLPASPSVPPPASAPPPPLPPPAEGQRTAGMIRASLRLYDGNREKTAKALGLKDRFQLYRLMKAYGIEDEEGE